MILDRVTITGADDSVDPRDLLPLSKRFPWVEWGILLSRSQEGGPRFPSLDWMYGLKTIAEQPWGPLKLSGHLCGAWVRALCLGSNPFEAQRPGIARMFPRVQLNFHAQAHQTAPSAFRGALGLWARGEYIFQFDAVNDALMDEAIAAGIRAVPLFDISGGAGIEPGEWPAPIGDYCGYAGGLHPDFLAEQLERIANAAGTSRIWRRSRNSWRSPSRG
jgi:hypothetical protein